MNVQWVNVFPGLWRSDYVTKTAIDAVGYLVALRGRELLVLSPPCNADAALFAQTDALGDVTALVANNSGHDLGQELWQKRYPLAVSFAPEVAVPKITRAKKALRPLQPLAALGDRLPDSVKFFDVAGTGSGMTLFSVDAGDAGRALFVDEIVSNSETLIGPLPFKVAFRLTGSGPGLARNRIWSTIFVRDKPGVATAVLGQIDHLQPTVILPAHGEPIGPERIAAVQALVQTLR